ncbi:MAG: TolC family protein [Limisphaerales bacterium]
MKTILSTVLLTAAVSFAAESEVPTSGTIPIDLATALKLGNARNFQIALAKERVNQASAELKQKEYLLIPSFSVGASWHHSEGTLQDSSGRIRDVSRSSSFFGGGAGAVGAGPIMQPGLSVTANLADIYFAPLAAKQNHAAMKAASDAVNNQVSLQIAEAYFDLVRARAGVAVAEEAVKNTKELSDVTANFASSGEGLQSDAQRAKVEQLIRQRSLEQAKELLAVSVARLAQLLHLEAGVNLEPTDANAAPVKLADASKPVTDLVATALENRPEVKQTASLVRRAEQNLKNARYAPIVPNLSVGVSGGGFGGGVGGGIAQTDVRTDVNALVFWRWESFGLGDKQRVKAQRSVVNQVKHSQTGVMDAIIAQVRQSYAQVNSRQKQIAIAEEAVRSARQSFELNRNRIFEKQGLPIEVLQAIQSLATARQLYVDTVTEYNQAQFRLLTAVGTK